MSVMAREKSALQLADERETARMLRVSRASLRFGVRMAQALPGYGSASGWCGMTWPRCSVGSKTRRRCVMRSEPSADAGLLDAALSSRGAGGP